MSFSSYINNSDYDSSEVDQEGAFSTINISSYRYPRSSFKTQNPNETSFIISWQRIFVVSAAVLILGIVVYYVHTKCVQQTNQVLIAQRETMTDLEEKIIEKQKRITELQWIKDNLINQRKEKRLNQDKPNQKKALDVKSNIIPIYNGDSSNVVIDVLYTQNDYSGLPINPLRRNTQNKRVQEALYKDEPTRKKREGFMNQRFSFVSSQPNFPSIFLAKYNLVNSEEQLKKAIEENERDWLRLQAKFQLSKLKEELPMCVVVPGYNNNANFRIEYNLNSIFTQNYTNYRIVVVNDASTDGGDEVYRNFFSFYAIDKQRYTYIENSKRINALHNSYFGSINHCSKDSIVLALDADDQLIGRNVLQVFNWAYQTKKAGVIYSNFYWFQQPHTLRYGFTSQYSQNEKKGNLFRSTPMKFSHLRSYRNELIFQIDPKDLQDQKGVFFTITSDFALLIPLMQLSCGRVHKIEGEFHYLYNVGTGLNDDLERGRQIEVENQVRKQKKYECFKQFNERMNK